MENQLLSSVMDISWHAGKEIMKIYEQDQIEVENKSDSSPLTEADRASHRVIVSRLSQLTPHIPILSEEGKDIDYAERRNWELFWLVDPLDGTKEFIKRNGDFTVNIALIQGGYPVLGVIHVPVWNTTYASDQQTGAIKIDEQGRSFKLATSRPAERVAIVESRSHPSLELEAFLEQLQKSYARMDRIQRGSSLKFCAVAEGSAHYYPRLGPTMEWDTAAGQAIVEAAGGSVVTMEGTRFVYNKRSLKNDSFIVKYDRNAIHINE